VDLDLGQVRAFVAAAEQAHFGRAAESLFVTQQALSKRIAKLEEQVGTLFVRGPSGVSLTGRGERFLPVAYQLLEAADHALATVRGDPPAPLRVDVWGPFPSLESTVRAFATSHPDTFVEVSMRRSLPAALDALRRNELDVALGNVANLNGPLGEGLSSELVGFTPTAAMVSDDAIMGADVLGPEDLGRHGLGLPGHGTRHEFAGFVTEFAAAMGAPLRTDLRNTGMDGLVDQMAAGASAVTLVPAAWSAPPDAGVRVMPIRPVPMFPWYAISRSTSPHPLLRRLVRALRRANELTDITDCWLPTIAAQDRARQRGGPQRA
jgi:DNA-binding transcriptional LysR family regulator